MMYRLYEVFFFKQKTAYEMRISDWSSDVCSSDLTADQQPDADQHQIAEHEGLYDLGVQRRQHIGAEHAADHPGDEQAKEERPVDVAVEHMAQPRHHGGENLDDVDTRRRGRGGNAETRRREERRVGKEWGSTGKN